MPWSASDLPPAAKNLTAEQKRVFVAAANNALASCIKSGGTDKSCAGRAIRIGLAAAKK